MVFEYVDNRTRTQSIKVNRRILHEEKGSATPEIYSSVGILDMKRLPNGHEKGYKVELRIGATSIARHFCYWLIFDSGHLEARYAQC
jgi:hypothetical protein